MKQLLCEDLPKPIYLVAVLVLSGCAGNPLSNAAYSGDIAVVRKHLANGSDPNYEFSSGMGSPLHNAVISGKEEIAGDLLKYGAELDKQAYAAGPPSHLKFGSYINSTDSRWAFGSPIMISAATGDKEMFDLFVHKGANVNQKVADNRFDITKNASALHFAAAGGNAEIVNYLIEAGLEIDSRISKSDNSYGFATPLHIAVGNKNIDITNLLLEAGANVNSKNENEVSVLQIAASENSPELVKLLIDHGANLNANYEGGRTSLSSAVFAGNFETAGILLANGASLTADSDKTLQAYTHHFAADYYQESSPDKAILLYSSALKLYEESIPELEQKAKNEKILDIALVALANVASAAISAQSAQQQANQIASVSSLNSSSPSTVKYYYTVPILTDVSPSNSFESLIARSKLGGKRVRSILQCLDLKDSDLATCGESAKQISEAD